MNFGLVLIMTAILENIQIKVTTRYQQAVTFNPTRLQDKRQGFSGRASYAFNNRYYADFVASYTGADNYMPGKQFGFFPAIAAGWVISEERLS